MRKNFVLKIQILSKIVFLKVLHKIQIFKVIKLLRKMKVKEQLQIFLTILKMNYYQNKNRKKNKNWFKKVHHS